MHKKVLKGLFALALIAIFATPSLAAVTFVDPAGKADTAVAISDANGVKGPGIFYKDLKFSTGVMFVYVPNTTDGSTFGLGTWNSKGTKAYATTSAASKMYSTVTKVDTVTLANALTIPSSGTPASSAWAEVGK